MKITIVGKQMDVGDSLKAYTEEHMESIAMKYFDSPLAGEAHFYHEGRRFGCDISIHIGQQLFFESHAETRDPYACVQKALKRIEKQLRRHKRKLRNHHRKEERKRRWLSFLFPNESGS